jgi:4-hydroxyphenylpyruvate dioxygenase-like putative hemolysin
MEHILSLFWLVSLEYKAEHLQAVQCRAGQGELCLVVTEDKAGMARQVMSTHGCRTTQAGTHMKENWQAAYGRHRRHERQVG